ncbi:hypothetical protein SDD30_08880 [Moorella naiadis]|uniref:hypothetical protein n=1 Tax=Moorella naiadis (nom. illeg.) TaxID=3093670 RepID=UPI003D9CB521
MSDLSCSAKGVLESILELAKQGPFYFVDILNNLPEADYRDILIAWGEIRERGKLHRDKEGRYILERFV